MTKTMLWCGNTLLCGGLLICVNRQRAAIAIISLAQRNAAREVGLSSAAKKIIERAKRGELDALRLCEAVARLWLAGDDDIAVFERIRYKRYDPTAFDLNGESLNQIVELVGGTKPALAQAEHMPFAGGRPSMRGLFDRGSFRLFGMGHVPMG
jgi:hypothetical protein